jgi:hypothetical protein
MIDSTTTTLSQESQEPQVIIVTEYTKWNTQLRKMDRKVQVDGVDVDKQLNVVLTDFAKQKFKIIHHSTGSSLQYGCWSKSLLSKAVL